MITGVSGYLGRRLAERAAVTGPVIGCYFQNFPSFAGGTVRELKLDIGDADAVRAAVDASKPRAMIHTAALNASEDCGALERVNTQGSENVARAAARAGCRLIHVSTDLVHDGTCAPYADDCPARPVNPYGHSKAEAELRVLDLCAEATVVRTSLIYDLQVMPRSTGFFAAELQRGRRISLFNEVLRQPVALNDLVDTLLLLIGMQLPGYLNVAGTQVVSRAYYEEQLLEAWGISSKDRITPVVAAQTPAAVPVDLRLKLERALSIPGVRLHGLDEWIRRHRPRTGNRGPS